MADQVFNVKCGFFDAVNNDRRYSANDINQLYSRIINDGVFPDAENNPSEDLEVSESSGMTILVNSGEGIFTNRWFNNQTIIPIDVPSNTAANGRIDSVIVQVDTTVSGRAGNIVYRTGEPSATPEPPTINSVTLVKEYRLANVAVASGATTISAADITDLRGTTACPWVTGIISADSVPPESITTGKIANRAITAPKLADDSITTAAIVDYTVTAEKLAPEAVTSERIAPGAVTEGKLANSSVTTNKIADYAVTSSRLANGAVTSAKLGVGAVTPAKIDGGAVTLAKLNSDVYESTPTSGSTKLITSGGVDTALAGKMNFAKTESIFETLTNEGEIYQKTVDNIDYYVWIIKKSDQNWVQFRCSVNGLEYRTHNTSWSLWDYVIPEKAIGIDNLANALLITSTSAQVLYDDYHLPTTRFMKENVERKVENPSKVLTFDSNNCISRVITVLSNQLSAGTILAGDIKAYVPNTITNITDGFLTTATDLTTLYINNYSDNVTLGTTIQQKIANEELTVYFIDEYNFADLMAISQRQLNERVTALENE